MAGKLMGRLDWKLGRDDEGHRTYTVKWLIRVDSPLDGPLTALNTPGLPLPGSTWSQDNDIDPWAWCKPQAKVERVREYKEGEKGLWWTVEQTFSTKPPDINKQRCQDFQIQDPLLEPMKIRGNFSRFSEEATHDRFGKAIVSSSHEQMRGQQVEFDLNRPSVKIEQNVANLELGLFSSMVNTVNDSFLWGLPPRTIKLSNVDWERKFYGNCSVYYTRQFEFDINYNTWDKQLLDEGSKVLNGRWDPDSGAWVLVNIPYGTTGTGDDLPPDWTNPAHFMRAIDRQGNPIRMVLNGAGLPAESLVSSVAGQQAMYINIRATNSLINYRLRIEQGTCQQSFPAMSGGTATTPGATCATAPTLALGTTYQPSTLLANKEHWFKVVSTGQVRVRINCLTILAEDQFFRVSTFYGGCGGLSLINKRSIPMIEGENCLPGYYQSRMTGVGSVRVEKYEETNFLLLGIPTVF